MTATDRVRLVTGFLNGSLPDEEVTRLYELLVVDADLRDLLAELAVQNARVGRLLKAPGSDPKDGNPSSTTLVAVRVGGPPSKPPPLTSPRPKGRWRCDRWLSAAVGTISSILGSVLRRGKSAFTPDPRLRPDRATSTSAASGSERGTASVIPSSPLSSVPRPGQKSRARAGRGGDLP